MKKRIVAVILAVVTVFGMAGCGTKSSAGSQNAGNSASATEKTTKGSTSDKVLRVGMEGTYAPYTYHDTNGDLTGYEVDVANAIGKKIGYKVEFVETKWDSMFEALDAGNFDVVMNQVTITDERKAKYAFSTPYVFSKPVLIVSSKNNDIKTFQDVKGKKAAEGLTSNFNQIAKSYGAEIVGQDEFSLAMECVLSGEADCAINDQLTYAYWKHVKDDKDTKIVAESNDVSQSAIVMKKGNDELLNKINDAISELLKDGTISSISQKYFSMDISKK